MKRTPPYFGPDPWRQTQWDARAAANFICGGAGAGLIAFAALAQPRPATGVVLTLLGALLVGIGLTAVSFELGRPWRAFNVFRNPATSWMSRESIAAVALFAAAGAVLLGIPGASWIAGVIALGFVYCQSRMLQSARGIPAWRAPATMPLLVATALAEGAGLYWFAALWHRGGSTGLLLAFAALVVLRYGAWLMHRRQLLGNARVSARLARPGRWLLVAGTLAPLALILLLASLPLSMHAQFVLAAFAGILVLATGAALKHALVLRASFNQGFALPEMPVRGVRSASQGTMTLPAGDPRGAGR